MDIKIQIPEIPEEELTPTVKALLNITGQCLEIIKALKEENQQLKDEIARLKGGNSKPKIKPSILENTFGKKKEYKRGERRKNRKKRMKINQEIVLPAEDVPVGSKFKGYKTIIVQDIVLRADITRYKRAIWKTPDGRRIMAQLPEGICGHYTASLRAYILDLSYGLNIPQHMIMKHLEELGFSISTGELSSILTESHEEFHQEKEHLLKEGLKNFSHVLVDDTGARHKGKNGYCTFIGNEFFAYFKSTGSKSRINFLEILRGKETDYVFTRESLKYMAEQGLSFSRYARLSGVEGRICKNEEEWKSFLKIVGIKNDKEVKIVTEAALRGSILSHGIHRDLVILSDEAGQFDILLHALCWLHAERKIAGILPFNDYQSKILDEIRTEIWGFYNALKVYKLVPGESMKRALESRFDEIFTQKTEFETINKALHLIYENKKGLLMVLERPELPLHNNLSENTIRAMVTKRKIHGGTRSETGRQCRDTFMSLKKTCIKLEISFHEYLHDRLSRVNSIPPLYSIMLKKAFSSP